MRGDLKSLSQSIAIIAFIAAIAGIANIAMIAIIAYLSLSDRQSGSKYAADSSDDPAPTGKKGRRRLDGHQVFKGA